MTNIQSIPAAQYLRMSTEHQQYSLDNQSNAIQRYAEPNRLDVVRTYHDAAKSGVVLRHRAGLRQLLEDVVGGAPGYQAILVYDVSRWGRFQDMDESAHYEFLCKSAGVPVHYCAETFANDGTLPSLIMKALKRTMAGEYSRELGVKVLAGQKRLAGLGFKQGGLPGYGLRRMLVSPSGNGKQALASGERKSLATDRVILVPGPAHEVQTVREIYQMFVSGKLSVYAIARELNRRGITYINGPAWDYQAVFAVLTHPKYSGCHVFGRTSGRLHTKSVKLPKSQWIVKQGAFEPIVDPATFAEAQKIVGARTTNRSDEELLRGLRALLASKARLSLSLIRDAHEMPSPSTYRHRFGSLRPAYELIGYGRPEQFGPLDLRCRTTGLREQLIARIVAMFPNQVSVARRGGRWRSRLRVSNGTAVSVLVSRSIRVWKDGTRWQIDPVRRERNFITLLARLDQDNLTFLDFYIFPKIDRLRRFRVALKDEWLSRGKRLNNLSEFCALVMQLRQRPC
jgi:DNA invertase Pin-like site-specific DNA recombinase